MFYLLSYTVRTVRKQEHNMIVNGFWFDETVVDLVSDMRGDNCETAGDFQKALKILYPQYRQITCEQDFRDFVEAHGDYADDQEAVAHYGYNE